MHSDFKLKLKKKKKKYCLGHQHLYCSFKLKIFYDSVDVSELIFSLAETEDENQMQYSMQRKNKEETLGKIPCACL